MKVRVNPNIVGAIPTPSVSIPATLLQKGRWSLSPLPNHPPAVASDAALVHVPTSGGSERSSSYNETTTSSYTFVAVVVVLVFFFVAHLRLV